MEGNLGEDFTTEEDQRLEGTGRRPIYAPTALVALSANEAIEV